jgi:hypothetical protein
MYTPQSFSTQQNQNNFTPHHQVSVINYAVNSFSNGTESNKNIPEIPRNNFSDSGSELSEVPEELEEESEDDNGKFNFYYLFFFGNKIS